MPRQLRDCCRWPLPSGVEAVVERPRWRVDHAVEAHKLMHVYRSHSLASISMLRCGRRHRCEVIDDDLAPSNRAAAQSPALPGHSGTSIVVVPRARLLDDQAHSPLVRGFMSSGCGSGGRPCHRGIGVRPAARGCTRTSLPGRKPVPPPTSDGHEEQLVLVDEPSLDRLGRERGTAHAEISADCRLQPPDRLRVERRSIRVLGAGHPSQRLE